MKCLKAYLILFLAIFGVSASPLPLRSRRCTGQLCYYWYTSIGGSAAAYTGRFETIATELQTLGDNYTTVAAGHSFFESGFAAQDAAGNGAANSIAIYVVLEK